MTNVSKQEEVALTNLSRDIFMKILPADKNNAIVVIDYSYLTNGKYRLLLKDPTLTIEGIHKVLKMLHERS